MSATNLDLPVLISPEQIRRREFVTTRRGYDPDQVRAYLEQLADQTDVMRSMLREAQAKAETAMRTKAQQPRVDPYDRLGERVASVIREADQVAETIMNEAKVDAEKLSREARAEADRIRTDTQTKAEEARARADEIVRAAREDANRTIAGLATRRDALVEQLASMRERLVGVARDLESAMDVSVTLPDIASVGSVFGELAEPEDGGDLDVAPSNRADAGTADHGHRIPPSGIADDVEAVASTRAEAADAGETVVLGEAEDADDDRPSVLDPAYEELWEGTDAIKLQMPDIPALDLDWGDEDDDSPYA